MPDIVQIHENLYDVGGRLVMPDDGVFDLSDSGDRECLFEMVTLMQLDDMSSVYGNDTVLCMLAGDQDEVIPVPIHVLDLDKCFTDALRRYRKCRH